MSSISEWWPSAAAIGFGTFLFGVARADLKGIETRLREDLKASEGRQQEALRAMETRQREELRNMRAEYRASNKALHEKLDRLMEGLQAAKAL